MCVLIEKDVFSGVKGWILEKSNANEQEVFEVILKSTCFPKCAWNMCKWLFSWECNEILEKKDGSVKAFGFYKMNYHM